MRTECVIEVLKRSEDWFQLSDLRRSLPSPRPGYLELERLILQRDDLFEFGESGAVRLSEAARSNAGPVRQDFSDFDAPEPRALIGYYEECVREDGKRIRAYGSHLGSSAMATESEWISSGQSVYSIPVNAENRDLILNNSAGSAAHYYGYPVLASWVEEEQLMRLVPILIWKLDRVGSPNDASPHLSFTCQLKEFRLNPEVLWSVPARQRKHLVELFRNADSVPDCLEMIQSGFLGHEVKEILYSRRLPKSPKLSGLGQRDEGIYNRGLYLSITPNSYVKGLATELSLLAKSSCPDLLKTSLSALFAPDECSESIKERAAVPVTRPLNAYQEAAVERALSNRLSVITGPPGTGKSEVVVAITANAMLEGRSILFASRNNAAITVVQNRIDSLLGVGQGLLRLGADFDSNTKQSVQQQLNRPPRRELIDLKLKAEQYDLLREDLDSEIASIARYEELAELAEKTEQHFLRSISCFEGNEKPELPVHYSPSLSEDLEQLIERLQAAGWRKRVPLIGSSLYKRKVSRVATEFAAVAERIENLFGVDVGSLTRLPEDDAVGWSKLVLGMLDAFGTANAAIEAAKELESMGLLDRFYEKLLGLREKLCELSEGKFRFLFSEIILEESRENGFLQGSRQFLDLIGARQEPAIHNTHPMQDVLKAFPCWAVSNLSACGRLPLTPGLFDLVIIDEAGQCDIPSCVPLLFRAKQAVIIGDPMQLGSITNLGQQTERSLLARHGIKNPGVFRYTGNSIYDLAAASAPSDTRTFLAQHYRCHPGIIEFANSAHWYDSNLEAVTDISSLRNPKGYKLGVSWINIDGAPKFEVTGYWIPDEADRIVDEVVRLLVENRFEGTVGVVTPFRRMANAIQERVEAATIHHSILEASQFRAATAHKFQGDERDVIFYAPCYHASMPNRHKWFLSSQRNVFNVALSRARSAFVVVGAKEAIRTSGIDYLEDFVEYVETSGDSQGEFKTSGNVQRGHWEPILETALVERGIPAKPQYPLGPFWLDFALIDGERCLDIEVDGEQFHKNESGMRCQKDIDRNIYIKSQGWGVMRFWVYQLRDDLEGCVNQIEKWWIEKN